jgi:adenylate cyclase
LQPLDAIKGSCLPEGRQHVAPACPACHIDRVTLLLRTRAALLVLVGAAAVGIVLAAYAGHVMRSLELKSVDARFGVRGSTGAPHDVVVVQIDDVTFNDLRDSKRHAQWPFPRRYHAKVVDEIAKGHPKAIAVDVQFTEPTTPRDDGALIDAVSAAKNVVLATTEVDEKGHTAIFGGDAVLRQIGARAGNGVLPADSDGVIRRTPFETSGLTSFGIVAAEIARGRPIAKPASPSPWIDFAGPAGTVTTYSYSRVLDGKVDPSAFTGKIVIVGPSAPTLQDIHATSTAGSEWMSGAEIQANVAATALRGFPLRDLPRGLGPLLVVLMGFVAPVAGLRLRAWRPFAVALAAGVVYVIAAQVAFDHGHVVLFTYPLAALLLSAVGVLGVDFTLEAFDRIRTRDAFSRFVPEAVVDKVLARTDSHLRLGGEAVIGTVMFTDLRGFTTFSENLSPAQVIDLLNEYLTEMTEAVLAHGGTLMSYLGDGLMAIFGAPLPQDDHADRALAAGREMLELRLPEFNARLRERGYDRGFKMGIGINTGEFMAGNVGSERRLEYTAIGDPINTASRIEGMTKGTPYALFLADATREALTRQVDDLVYVEEMAVRGRAQAIKIWSLSSPGILKEDWESELGAKPAPDPGVPAPAQS